MKGERVVEKGRPLPWRVMQCAQPTVVTASAFDAHSALFLVAYGTTEPVLH